MWRKGRQSLRYLSKQSMSSIIHKRSHLKKKKASDSAQKPTKECKLGYTDVFGEAERVRTSQPERQVPEMQSLNNGSLLSLNKNNISFSVGINKSKSLTNETSTRKRELEQKLETNAYLLSTEELWRKECARLKRELEDAETHAEGISLPSKEAPSSSKSRNEPASL